jgi:hypothetical protein
MSRGAKMRKGTEHSVNERLAGEGKEGRTKGGRGRQEMKRNLKVGGWGRQGKS